MIISMIAAMGDNRVIGVDGDMPWRLPADLKWFKQTTLGKPVIMGRKTYESIGRALPGRTNVVITRQADFTAEGCTVVHSIDEALQAAGDVPEVMIIGGAAIYQACIPRAERLYMTIVHAAFDGDTYFPEFDASKWEWTPVAEHNADDRNAYDTTYFVLDRIHTAVEPDE